MGSKNNSLSLLGRQGCQKKRADSNPSVNQFIKRGRTSWLLFQAKITISVTSRGGGGPGSTLLLAGCRFRQMPAQATQVWEVPRCFSSPLLSFFPLFSQHGEQSPVEGMPSFCTLLCQSSRGDLCLPPCHQPTRDSLLQLLSLRDGLQETISIFLDKSWQQLQLLRDTAPPHQAPAPALQPCPPQQQGASSQLPLTGNSQQSHATLGSLAQ